MPILAFVATLAAALGLLAAVAVVFWHEILSWAEDSLFPWIELNIPSLTDVVRTAFLKLDTVIIGVRQTIKRAWSRLRQSLLKQTIELERRSTSQWVRRVTSWVIRVVDDGTTAPVRLVTEDVLSPDDLPADVREAYIRHGQTERTIDVTALRDNQLTMEISD